MTPHNSTQTSERLELKSNPGEVLRMLLNQEGFRVTEQRQKILEVMREVPEGDHLSAEGVYQKLTENGEKIGFSTIYRALHLLVDLGILRELALSEERKFYEFCDPLTEAHHHLICAQCGTVQEFEDATVLTLGSNEAINRGFSVLDCQFTVHGLCPKCAEAGRESI